MNRTFSKFIAAAVLSCFSVAAIAEAVPVQFSFFDFNAPEAKEVSGFRFPAIYGKQGGNITGVDFQLLAYSEIESLKGVSIPLFWLGANTITGNMTGASFGLFNNHKGNDIGANLGFLNLTNNVNGANVSAVNFSTGDTLVDVGFVSISKASTVQVGFFNMTDEIKGVQIGLLNCAKDGFLPCFPFVNFKAQ